jgi:hypothetical protein
MDGSAVELFEERRLEIECAAQWAAMVARLEVRDTRRGPPAAPRSAHPLVRNYRLGRYGWPPISGPARSSPRGHRPPHG